MKFWYWILFLNLFGHSSFSQNLSLTVIADGQQIMGVSIYINGRIKAVTNEKGNVQLTNLIDGDTIRAVYLGYRPETIIFSSHKKELTINLIEEIFDLREIVVSSKNDKSLFKKMLKWGLQDFMIHKPVPFCITDTLCFLSENDTVYCQHIGNFIYPIRGHEIAVKKVQTKFLYRTSVGTDKEKQLTNNIKKIKGDIEICFCYPYGLVGFNRDVKYAYIGSNSEGFEQFYFYVPNGDWIHATTASRNKAYCGGIVYLDSIGVIKKIKMHKTPLDSSVVGYEFDVDYTYDEKRNEIIPYQAFIHTYMLDKVLKVSQVRKSHLEIYSKQAIESRLVHSKW